ncbi:MAG: ribonuclease HI [Planctomycetota bacterium]|jgi:ribonuclease HI
MEVVIYTDGACRGNPGPGGWGALLAAGGKLKELKGADRSTTNNRMELLAAIEALDALTGPSRVVLYTDSNYVKGGITEWMRNWKRNGWRTAAKKPVKNQDLWRRLDAAAERHEIEWHWVKGHSGDPGNDRADELANEAIDALLAG